MSQSDLLFIGVDDVIEIHDFVLETGIGLSGVDLAKLDGIVGRVKNQTAYGNSIRNPFELAAHYAQAIAQGHAFIDANKRTAFIAMFAILDVNGYPLPNHDSYLENFNSDTYNADLMVNVATGKLSAEDLANRLGAAYLIYQFLYNMSNIASLAPKKND